MPRAPVDPHNRKRALQACVPCKISKKRCNSKTPCCNCLKRSDRLNCTYSNPEKPRIPGNVASPAQRRNNGVNSPRVGARMLWTSRGSQVYIGGSASLSFLHLLRDMLTRYMGPSKFTNDTRSQFMLETQRDQTLSPGGSNCPYGMSEMTELVDTFLAATCGIMDLIDRTEILHHLRTSSQMMNNNTTNDAVVHAMIAIGAQCRAEGSSDQQCERLHLSKAQEIAFANMLEDPSIYMVRLFLVLSFYMLGACRRNAAFMYIGVAARAAYVLGLHHDESYNAASLGEKTSWLTTWKSVRILDLLVSSILGRPPATSDIEDTPSADSKGSAGENPHRQLCFEATLGIWSIVDQIVKRFYRQNDFDLSSATSFLSNVQTWSSNLSTSLKTHSPTDASILRNKESAIGSLHVACSYYYAVMLATRKYLISKLASDLATNSHSNLEEELHEDKTSKDFSEMSRLAQTCVESAILTLQTCKEVSDANMLLQNMCLLKAWIFGAALVLGFAMFTKEITDSELEDAFNGGNSVLSMLAVHSPQAKHYFDILSNLHIAIRDYHQQKASKRKQTNRNKFVEKIFSMNNNLTIPQDPQDLRTDTTGPNTYNELDTPAAQWLDPLDSGNLADLDFSNDMSMSFEGIDSVAVQLWDEFVLGQDPNTATW